RDFRSLIPRRRPGRDEESVPPRKAEPISQSMRMLCLVALRSPEARERLAQPEMKELLALQSGWELLSAILAAGGGGGEAAFSAQLSAEDESELSALMLDPAPENAVVILEDCIAGLQRE